MVRRRLTDLRGFGVGCDLALLDLWLSIDCCGEVVGYRKGIVLRFLKIEDSRTWVVVHWMIGSIGCLWSDDSWRQLREKWFLSAV